MNEVFADSHYFIALLNQRDRFHATAVAESLRQTKRIVTTLWVLAEVADALCKPAMRSIAEQFLRFTFQNTAILIVRESETWFSRGLDLYGQRLDKSWSLTDCISFVVMQERGIQDALTGDHHFAQAGFNLLLVLPHQL
jgi:predicted nucleic acid-binding protein